MSDRVIKSGLTAYQRWEAPAFDIPDEAAALAAKLPTAADVERMYQQAHEEGYQAGAQQARDEEQKARDEAQVARDEAQVARDAAQVAHDEAQVARDEALRIAETIGALERELQRVDQQVAQNLLDLSMELSKQMLRRALEVKPELLLAIVNEAIKELPHFNQHPRLILHPSDAELVRAKLGEQLDHNGWKIFEDEQLEPGGCRVETAHSQVDASLETRWKRVVSAIGQDDSWLTP